MTSRLRATLVGSVLAGSVWFAPGIASAQEPYTDPPPELLCDTAAAAATAADPACQTPDPAPRVLGTTATRTAAVAAAQGAALPLTGGDVAGLVLVGAGLAAAGYGVTRVVRRPAVAS